MWFVMFHFWFSNVLVICFSFHSGTVRSALYVSSTGDYWPVELLIVPRVWWVISCGVVRIFCNDVSISLIWCVVIFRYLLRPIRTTSLVLLPRLHPRLCFPLSFFQFFVHVSLFFETSGWSDDVWIVRCEFLCFCGVCYSCSRADVCFHIVQMRDCW